MLHADDTVTVESMAETLRLGGANVDSADDAEVFTAAVE